MTDFHIQYPDIDHRGFLIGQVCLWTAVPNPPHPGASYQWSATAGSFPYGTTGPSVTWIAPSSPGYVTIYCTASGGPYNPPVTDQRIVDIIRLDKVRVGYCANGGSFPPYPNQYDLVQVRAVVWATCASQVAYGIATTGQLYETGCDETGETGGDDEPLADPETLDASPSAWPSLWPVPSFVWTKLYHSASDNYGQGNHIQRENRQYWYDSGPVSSWGYWGGDVTLPVGTIRYKVSATLGPMVVYSLDGMQATRISVRDADQPTDPYGRYFLGWAFAFDSVAYEWGGRWFGGLDSEDAWVGGSPSYDHCGIQCCGLVAAAAVLAGYDAWSAFPTTHFISPPDDSQTNAFTSPVSDADFTAGDILNRRKHHVVICFYRNGDDIDIIEAAGTPVDKVQTVFHAKLHDYLDKGYKMRRLVP